MTVSCPECKSVFRVDPAKVPATGVRARCSVCGGIIAIAGGTLPVSVTPSSASMAIPAFAGGTSRATPIAPPTMVTPLSVQAATAPMPPAFPVSPQGQPAPATSPSFAPPMRRTPAFGTPLPTPPTPSVAVPPAEESAFSTSLAGGAPMPAASGVATAVAPLVTPALGMPVAGGTPAAGKRPINPFLRADPSQRARRLARALVSDLVAYHPQKREEGLRDGTLRQLFREEIKKSYEEYVEQVGRDVAEGAPHFQDALNDILAGGRRLF